MANTEAAWEAFIQKVEASFPEIDGTLDDVDLNIAWDEFTSSTGTIENAIARIADRAAQQVVDYFSRTPDAVVGGYNIFHDIIANSIRVDIPERKTSALITMTDGGIVVDLFPIGGDMEEPVASTWALMSEMEEDTQ
jgi:hypothetical protein